MRSSGDDIKKRRKQREDLFLRRLFGMLAKMAKAKVSGTLAATKKGKGSVPVTVE